MLLTVRDDFALASVVLLYLTVVVAVAALGGLWPALTAAVASDLLVNFFFVPPFHTFTVENRDHVIVLLVYMASQTLLPSRGESTKVAYSDLIREGVITDADLTSMTDAVHEKYEGILARAKSIAAEKPAKANLAPPPTEDDGSMVLETEQYFSKESEAARSAFA